jgi:hypothetical protein
MVRAVPSIVFAASLLVPTLAYAQGGDTMMNCKKLFSARSTEPASHVLVGEPKPGEPEVHKNRVAVDVRVDCDDMQLFADEIEWRDDEQTVSIKGHVLFTEPGVRVQADHAIMNRITKLGTFYDASGYTQIATKPGEQALFGGMEPDMYFWGAELVKVADRTYRLVDGGFTSCVQATPRWDMGGSTGSVTLEKHVMLKNAVLRVKDVPLFYLPVMYYPINKENRATGFLMPKYGSSTAAGFTLSNAFFWAIDRSQDATIYHSWFKKGGNSLGGRYEYSESPGSNGQVSFNALGQPALTLTDGTSEPATKSYNVSSNVNQELPYHFRVIGNVDYFTNATSQQLYQQDIMDISQRTRFVNATLSGAVQRMQINATFQQNDVYNSLSTATRHGYLPRVTLALTQKRIGSSRVYFGAAGEVAYIVRRDNVDDPTTDHSLWRFDGGPQVRVPLSTLTWLTVTSTANWRLTEWMQSIDQNTGAQVAEPLTRQILTFQTTLTGPVLSKVYEPNSNYAEKIKHLIEPNLSFTYVSPFNELPRVVQNDGTDTIIGGTMTIAYGFTNRLLAKKKAAAGAPPGSAVAVPILQVDIGQSYYTNALAATFDPSYAQIGLAPPTPFSPVQIAVSSTPTPAITARFVTNLDAQFKVPRDFSASGSLNEKVLQITAGWIKKQVIPGLIGYNDPTTASHYLNLSGTVKRADGRFGGTYSFNYDIMHGIWLQRRLIAYYNSQCCGIQFDYQTADITQLGLNNTSNRHFGVSFTLAGLGSFANPMGSPVR